MAVTQTTLSSAVTLEATTIKVAAATGFGKGKYIEIDGELLYQHSEASSSATTIIPVLRGYNGTVQAAHPSSAKVVVGSGYDDFPNAGGASASPSAFPVQPNRPRHSYSASGALSPVEGLHVMNGTGALTMTLANPTALQDGAVMSICSNGKAAHTVTYDAGLGNAGSGYTVVTFPSGGQTGLQLIALNAIWTPLNGPYAGTVTAIDLSVA